MVHFAEYLRPTRAPFWTLLRQLGVEHVVSSLDRELPSGGHRAIDLPWEEGALRQLVHRYERAGLRVAVIEDGPPLDCARLGLPGADDEIEQVCTLVRSMGAVGIPVLCYNWMSVIPWLRTSTALPGRGNALVTGFDAADLAGLPPTWAGEVPEAQLWDTLATFLRRVVPVAERAGVRLALHPDDPPYSPIRGVARILTSLDAFQRVLDLVDSPANALTFCQGNFSLLTDDVPGALRQFGCQGRVAFGHFRDVRGTPERFVETFHDDGQTDMYACMRAWLDIGFDGVLRPDHVPTLEGEANDQPGYAYLGRLHALGYMTGLREAALAERTLLNKQV